MQTIDLMQIQSFIQSFVLAISSILEAEVTVIDANLIRIGGSGSYANKIGQKISHSSFFQNIIDTGRPGFIRDTRQALPCSSCQQRAGCMELANIGFPIIVHEKPSGVIGIVAFTDEQRETLLKRQQILAEFLKYMCALLESKLITQDYSNSLERQLTAIISEEQRLQGDTPFLGEDRAIRNILALVQKISAADSSVLITGESGTGKEVLAKRIHALSPRRNKLMISVNCGALPENLVESELFGYEEGAFTGARKGGYTGKFELANGSTLFLDEITEMPLTMQTKLLRVLQEKTVERLGGKTPLAVDVRIIAATNRDIEALVRDGLFRSDLYYRLNVIPIKLPPLRERRGDIPLLVNHFIQRYNRLFKKHIEGMDAEAMQLITHHDWPGNVRELNNLIEYLENIVDTGRLGVSDLPIQFQRLAAAKQDAVGTTLRHRLESYEKRLLQTLLQGSDGSAGMGDLARQLGISRATLYRKLTAFGLTGCLKNEISFRK